MLSTLTENLSVEREREKNIYYQQSPRDVILKCNNNNTALTARPDNVSSRSKDELSPSCWHQPFPPHISVSFMANLARPRSTTTAQHAFYQQKKNSSSSEKV